MLLSIVLSTPKGARILAFTCLLFFRFFISYLLFVYSYVPFSLLVPPSPFIVVVFISFRIPFFALPSMPS